MILNMPRLNDIVGIEAPLRKVIAMKKDTVIKLEKQGWKVGTASDFLKLSRKEEEQIEANLTLSRVKKQKVVVK